MTLKIYFCGSIRGGTDDAPLYANIIAHLQSYGQVLTYEVGTPDVLESKCLKNGDKSEHDKCIGFLHQTDVMVAEVTKPSLGVGYEIGHAVAMNIPILCLYRPQPDTKLSAMIQGAHDGEKFVVVHYKEEDAFTVIDHYLEKFKK